VFFYFSEESFLIAGAFVEKKLSVAKEYSFKFKTKYFILVL